MSEPLKPDFWPSPEAQREVEKLLYPLWQDYTVNVSEPEHAMSLQASAFVSVLAENMRVGSIGDLGSGWSTAALAFMVGKYCAIRSIDDSPDWLKRTRQFLSAHDLPVDSLSKLTDSPDWAGFWDADLVVFDLGNMATRVAHVGWAMRCATRAVYFDDMHMPGYPVVIKQACHDYGWTLAIAKQTMDGYGRFGAVAYKEGE